MIGTGLGKVFGERENKIEIEMEKNYFFAVDSSLILKPEPSGRTNRQ